MDNSVSREFLSSLIGMSRASARDLLTKNNIRFRIISDNGKSCGITADWVPTRINLTIVDDVIKSVSYG
jgi:hypothetical protein